MLTPVPTTTNEPEPRTVAANGRTCVGCGAVVSADEREDLVRFILGPGGQLAIDQGRGGFGRGVYVHPQPSCLQKAAQAGLARAARSKVVLAEDPERPLDAGALAWAVSQAMIRRAHGLLLAAVRRRAIEPGFDAVQNVARLGKAELILFATDAKAAAAGTEVHRAIADGRARPFLTKSELAEACGRPESPLGVVAITNRSIAGALRDALDVADSCLGVAVRKPVSKREAEQERSEGPSKSRSYGKKFFRPAKGTSIG